MKTRVQKLDNVISTPLDRRVVEQLSKGGRSFDYISGPAMYVLLQQAFGPFFSIEYSEPRYMRYDKARPNDQDPAPVVEVKCTITVPFYDEETKQTIMVKREGFGTATMKAHFEEMVLKTAQTDAMKKAAYSFGLALELSAQKSQNEAEWYQENVFHAWTRTNSQKYQKELGFVQAAMQKLGLQDMNAFAAMVLGDAEAKLTPDNIRDVIRTCQEKSKKAKEEKVA